MPECISQSLWKWFICCIQFNFFFHLHLSSCLIHGSRSFTTFFYNCAEPYIWHCCTSWGPHASTVSRLVQFSLGGVQSLRHVNPTTQLFVFCKLSVGAVDPTVSSVMLLNSTGPSMAPWGCFSSLISILPLDFLKLNFLSTYVIFTLI